MPLSVRASAAEGHRSLSARRRRRERVGVVARRHRRNRITAARDGAGADVRSASGGVGDNQAQLQNQSFLNTKFLVFKYTIPRF